MKYSQRILSLLLTLVLLVGLMAPVAKGAIGDISLPTADCEEIVFDYGKTVSVPIATIQSHITPVNGITVSGFAGITLTGENSKILSASPSGVYCINTGTDKSVTTTQGTLVRTSTDLQYTPTSFQDQITRVYALFSLSGSSTAKYIQVEVRFIPSSIMYYEAEDFPSEISTYDTTDGGTTNTAWRTVDDRTGSGNTLQDTDYVGETTFSPSHDKKHIAAGAFFSDFDGTGNASRYSKDPVYESQQTGLLGDFDTAAYWGGNGTSDSVNTNSGLLTMNLQTTNNYHYVQTVTSGGGLSTSPISLRPSMDDIFEVRFRFTGVEKPTSPAFILCISTALGSGVDVSAANRLDIPLDPEQVYNGDFITIRADMKDFSYYCKANMIYSFRLDISNLTAKSGGTMQVDYVYLGPKEGVMLPVTAAETGLYFGFETAITHTDPKSTQCIKSADYSSVSNWSTDADTTISITDGILYVKDKTTSGSSYTYNSFQPGGKYSDNTTVNYVCTGDEIFVIKFRTSTIGTVTTSSGKARLRLEYRISGSNTIYDDETNCYIDFTPSTSYKEYTAHLKLTAGTVLSTIRPTFYYTQSCTFLVDYFYLVPNATYEDINANNKYFFDFTRTMNERVHTTRNAYSHQRLTYYNEDGIWTYNEGYVEQPTISNGCLVLKDANTKTLAGDYHDSIYARLKNLHLDPDKPHYLQIRLRIDPVASGGSVTKGTGNPRFYLSYYTQAKTSGASKEGAYNSTAVGFNLTERVSKGWFNIYLNIGACTEYNTAASDPQKWVVDIAPLIAGTQGAKVTIDYLFIGVPEVTEPATEANPTAEHLYFGFKNDLYEETYKKPDAYHSNDIYGGFNFDTAGNGGNWATNSEANASAKDYTVTNGNLGLLSVNVSADKPAYDIHGPYISTTKTNNNYSYTNASYCALKYHPQENSIFQIRFRLNGCTVQSGKKPKLVFLFNGYDTAGSFKNYGHYTYNERFFVPTEDFQTITIPLSRDFCNMAIITNIGMRFQYIRSGKVEIDYIYVGPVKNTDPTYGKDSSYSNDSLLSNGKSLLGEGKGVRLDPSREQLNNGTYTPAQAYTESIFSFTGTGFDIISRTGPAQGAIRVSLYNATSPNDLTTDTLIKTMTVNNYGTLALYQIPVVSIQGLSHGTYYVKIGVNKEVNYGHPALDRGKEFHFDALRIYDPIDTSATSPGTDQYIAEVAYNDHNEHFSFIKEIREQLLSVSDFSKLTFDSSTAGAIFVDSAGGKTLTVKDYNKQGPKNEIYLAPGEAIAFKLTLDTNKPPFSVDIGAKSILGDATTLSAGFVTKVDTSAAGLSALSAIKQNISTSTGMYYPLELRNLDHKATNYLVIYNSYTGTDASDHILSVTDLKICYRNFSSADIPTDNDVVPGTSEVMPEEVLPMEKPEVRTPEATEEILDPYSFHVDAMTTTAVEVFLDSLVETPLDPTPTALEGLQIGHSLDLASDISLNYAIPAEALAEYDSFRLDIKVPIYNGSTFVDFTYLTPEAVEKNGFYYFTVKGLTAVHMMDELEANLYLTKDNQVYYTPTDIYSIATYALSKLDSETASPALKTLCADLLRYGSKAQLYKHYRRNTLSEDYLTESYLAYCTDLETVTFGNNNHVLEDMEAPQVLWLGKSMTLDSRVGIRYIVDTAGYEGDVSSLTLRLTYVDQKGEEKTVILTDPTLYREGTAWYAFDYYGLLASELRTAVSATVYEADTPLSKTISYSADTYGNNKQGDLDILCRALMAYSDSAKAFFAAN